MKKNVLIRILSLVVVLACVFAFAGCYDDTEVKDSVNATQTSLEEAKTALNAAIDAVKETADAAATKAALEEAVAKLEAAMKTSGDDAAATKAALEEAIAGIEEALVNYGNDIVGIQDALRELRGVASAAATQVALEEAVKKAEENKKELDDAIASIEEALVNYGNDIVGIQDALREVKGIASGAVTQAKFDETVAGIEEALVNNGNDIIAIRGIIRQLQGAAATAATQAALDEAVKNADAKIEDLKVDLAAEVKTLNDAIAALKVDDKVANLQGQIESLKNDIKGIAGDEGTVSELKADLAELEEKVNAIDTEAFKKEYIAVTEILLGGEDEPKSFYSFLKIINDNIDFGGYDDESVLAYERKVEEIKFALSRAVALADIDKAFEDLAEAEKGLVLLVDALQEKLEEITLINLGEDCTKKIESLKGIYEKIVNKNNKIIEEGEGTLIEVPEALYNDYVLKTGAYDTLKGFADDKGVQINGKIHPIFSVNKVLLASDATDIDAATTLIEGLVNDVLGVDAAYFALYTNDVYTDLYNLALENALTELVDGKKAEYVSNGIAAKAEEIKNAWISTEVAAKLAADDTLDETTVTDEVTAAANEADKLAEFAAQASTAVKATLEAEADAKAEEFKTEVMTVAEANAKIAADKQAATSVANALYNKAEYTAVNTRYELLKLAKDDAIVADGLLDKIKTIAGAWLNSRPSYNDTNIANVVEMKNEWIANAKYKNNTDFGTFTACAYDIEADNVNYILDEDRLLTLASADTYVKDMAKVYADHKVAELVKNIKTAVNGNVDVDNANIDTYIAAVATMDAAIEAVKNYSATLDKTDADNELYSNKHLMVSQELRERLAVINDAYDDVLDAIEDLKNSDGVIYGNNEWTIENINAGKQIATYKDALAAIYAEVAADSSDDNKITSVTSTIGEEELAAVQAKFEIFAENAIEAYNKASATINKIDDIVAKNNGKLTLDLGDDIYDAIDSINKAAVTGAIKGLNLNTIFTIPVVDEAGEQTMEEVQFRDLYNRLYEYEGKYREMAESNGVDAAEDVAAELTALVKNIWNYNGSKLDKYNEIIALYEQIVEEWVDVYFVNMTPAEAVAATNEVKKLGGGVYAFITNETFKQIKDKYDLANKTYAAAKTAAESWITKAGNLADAYTFHDWEDFEELEKEYNELILKYYNENSFTETTDPGFGLYAAHAAFAVEYGKCERMASEAQTEIDEIIAAIKKLTALEDITIDNYVTVRTEVDAVKALISAFEDGYCANAQEDEDFIVDQVNYNVVLAKADKVVEIFEVGYDAIGTEVEGTVITEEKVISNANSFKSALAYATDVETVNTVYETFKSFVVA